MKKAIAIVACVFSFMTNHAQTGLPTTQIKELKSNKKVAFNEIFEPGKVTVVNIWATWCVSCKKEIKNYSLKMPEWKKDVDFNYLTISIDEVRAEGVARSYAISQGWEFPCYIDVKADLKRSLNFQSCPYTIIIDQHGKIVYTHIGYEEGGENSIFEKVKEIAKK